MAEDPQDHTELEPPRRNERGQLVPGGGSLNPGGRQKKDVAKALRRLAKGSSAAADYLNRVIAGEETTTVVTKAGAMDIPVPAKDRIAAALGTLKLLLPKQIDIKDRDADPATRELAREVLVRLARLDS